MVSIITINFNSSLATLRLAKSLKDAIKGELYELIVVDNDSSEEQKSILRESPIADCVVYNGENSGFAEGNNIGIKAAKGEYIMLLNNDTIVDDDAITPLINYLKRNPSTGVACSKILSLENRTIIQFGGYAPIGRYMIDINSIYNGATDNCQMSRDVKTPFAHGAAMMFRRKDIEVVGFMPTEYFLYFEELDWSLRFTQQGYDIVCVGDSRVYHEGSHTMKQSGSYIKIYYNIRNRLIFAKKNLKGGYRVGNIAFQLFISYPKTAVKFLLKGDFVSFKATNRGVLDFMIHRYGKINLL